MGVILHSLGRQRGFIDVSGRPHAAKIVSNPLSYFKDQYNLTWTVDSFLPIKEYRILYRVFTVSLNLAIYISKTWKTLLPFIIFIKMSLLLLNCQKGK